MGANLLKQETLHKNRVKFPEDWNTNMAAVTSCENALLKLFDLKQKGEKNQK